VAGVSGRRDHGRSTCTPDSPRRQSLTNCARSIGHEVSGQTRASRANSLEQPDNAVRSHRANGAYFWAIQLSQNARRALSVALHSQVPLWGQVREWDGAPGHVSNASQSRRNGCSAAKEESVPGSRGQPQQRYGRYLLLPQLGRRGLSRSVGLRDDCFIRSSEVSGSAKV